MSDGQSLAHLPRFLREKLEKADARVGVRALPLVKHVALRGTNQHFVNRRTEIVHRWRLGWPDPLGHHRNKFRLGSDFAGRLWRGWLSRRVGGGGRGWQLRLGFLCLIALARGLQQQEFPRT